MKLIANREHLACKCIREGRWIGMDIDSIIKRAKTEPRNARLHVELARAYLAEGDEGKARDLAVRCWNSHSGDLEVFRGWAEVCEELGMARQARHCYGQALKLNPEDAESLYRLGSLCTDTGHYEDALRYLKKALKLSSGHESARTLLAENYSLMGFAGQAEAIAPSVPRDSHVLQPRSFPPSASQKETDRFQRLFSGREVGYALQEIDPGIGEIRFVFQNGCLNHELISAHILGKVTLAVYPLRSDNTVRYSVISIRLPSRVVEANIKNQGYLGVLKEQMRSNALPLVRFIQRYGLPAYIEDAGRHEYRIWLFFEKFIHFLKAKRLLGILIEDIPIPAGNFIIEPVLATKPVGVGWVERPVPLPLGIERSTLKRSLFLDGDGNAYGNQLKFLKKIRPVQARLLTEILHAPRSAQSSGTHNEKKRTPAVKILLGRCPVIRELVRKAEAGALLRRDEKVILFYTIGLTDAGTEALHEILESCPDYNYEKVRNEASRLKARPVSCVKMRELVPEITSSLGCSCDFDLRGNKYPSPLLHVNPELVPASSEFSLHEQTSIRDAARRYINLLAHLEEIHRAQAKLESFLDQQFLRKKVDRVKVDKMLLCRGEQSGTVNWRLERN